jgi:hypothetical protein
MPKKGKKSSKKAAKAQTGSGKVLKLKPISKAAFLGET